MERKNGKANATRNQNRQKESGETEGPQAQSRKEEGRKTVESCGRMQCQEEIQMPKEPPPETKAKSSVTTEEPIDDDVDEAGSQRLIQLKLRNGARSCVVEVRPDGKFLITEWNVIGEE